MNATSVTLKSHSPAETTEFAARLAATLRGGDCLLLDGPVGAGKTHFARGLIQSLLPAPEDVPSPTYTLVQSYDTTAGPLFHADLYRLTGTDEIEELGLPEAFESAICIVEWPDRLGPLAPRDALRVTFAADDNAAEARCISFGWSDARWSGRIPEISNA